MSALQEFQNQHGQAWGEIVNSPAFTAAMMLLNAEKMAFIAALTPADIESSGKLILADLVGHLRHENDLAGLPTKEEFVFAEVKEDYPNPIDELPDESSPAPAQPPSKPPRKTRKKP